MKIFADLKKKLTQRTADEVEAAEDALRTIDAGIREVRAMVEGLQASYGESLIGGTPADVTRLEEELRNAQQALLRLGVAKDAVEGRLSEAKTTANEAAMAKRWEATRTALAKRRNAFVALEAAAATFAKAYSQAADAVDEANEAMPMRVQGGVGAARMPIVPQFSDLAPEAVRLLALATNGAIGPFTGSALWELQQHAGLVARADIAAGEWLAMSGSSSLEDAA